MDLSILHITDLHAENTISFFDDKIKGISSIINNCLSDNVLILFSNNESNEYYLTQARLIAQRFYFENKQFVLRNKRPFLDLIGGYSSLKRKETIVKKKK